MPTSTSWMSSDLAEEDRRRAALQGARASGSGVLGQPQRRDGRPTTCGELKQSYGRNVAQQDAHRGSVARLSGCVSQTKLRFELTGHDTTDEMDDRPLVEQSSASGLSVADLRFSGEVAASSDNSAIFEVASEVRMATFWLPRGHVLPRLWPKSMV